MDEENKKQTEKSRTTPSAIRHPCGKTHRTKNQAKPTAEKAVDILIPLYSSFNFTRTQAASANVNFLRSTVYYSSYTSYIWFPCTVWTSVRMTYFYTEGNAFSTYFTFCHLYAPPIDLYNNIYILSNFQPFCKWFHNIYHIFVFLPKKAFETFLNMFIFTNRNHDSLLSINTPCYTQSKSWLISSDLKNRGFLPRCCCRWAPASPQYTNPATARCKPSRS